MQQEIHSHEGSKASQSYVSKVTSCDYVNYELIKESLNAPYLSKKEELKLIKKLHNKKDDRALHMLIQAHMRLVISIAVKFKRYNLPMSDLVQEGTVGILEAAARFEIDKNVRFSTYATWWIRASIQDYILRNWSIVRAGTSSAQKSLFFNLRRLRAKLAAQDKDISREEIHAKISQQVGVSPTDVEVLEFRFASTDNSLNTTLSPSDDVTVEKLDLIIDDSPLPDKLVASAIDSERQHIWLYDALKVLNSRELEIIKTRRLTDDALTLEELGKKLGISKERVRQIESRAMQKLRNYLLTQNDKSSYIL